MPPVRHAAAGAQNFLGVSFPASEQTLAAATGFPYFPMAVEVLILIKSGGAEVVPEENQGSAGRLVRLLVRSLVDVVRIAARRPASFPDSRDEVVTSRDMYCRA